MDMLQGLQSRVSMPLLVAPAPNSEQLENIWQAALRAPDHGNLKPYRFILVEGEASKPPWVNCFCSVCWLANPMPTKRP